ncbi:zf-HC2 domain-containing protein [Nocardioides sp. KR10-350]|uniref:zf-HC2 domain-containing protein n=1 Tax=Nocardioides cheoyonin TaxID=3156615 RepID=UPI0032B62369
MTGLEGHERYADWDGAYVVGALSPAERAEFERHLAGCALCRHAVTALAPLPGLLARVDPEDAEALLEGGPSAVPELPPELATPPADLERRLLAAAGQQSPPSFWRRTSTRVGLGLAAAAAVAAAVVVPVSLQGSDGPAPQAQGVAVALRPRVETPLTADVALTPVAWGTRIEMTCWYAKEPYDATHSYALYVLDHDGRPSLVSRWHASPGDTANTSGSTDLAVADIRQVQLRDGSTGQVLLAGRPG